MDSITQFAPEVQPEIPIDPVTEADRLWWASVSSSEWWADLGEDRVADAYGTPDDDNRDQDAIDYHFRSRPHDRPSDEDQPWYSRLGRSRGYIDRP